MKRSSTRRAFLAGSGVTVLAGLAGCSGLTPFVGKRIDGSLTVDPGSAAHVAVDVKRGDVTLQSAERSDIGVDFVKKSSSVQADLSALSLETTRSDGTIQLRSVWRGDEGLFGGRPQLDLDATVPTTLSIGRVETKVGDISLTELSGDIAIASDTGDLIARRVTGTIRAETETGDVEIRDAQTVGDLQTETGDIVLRGPDTVGDMHTETGDIDADVPAIHGETEIVVETGDVTVRVGPAVEADLLARTETGSVSIEGVSLSNRNRSDDFVGESVRGSLGGGGPRLLLESETGDVTVRSLS